MMTNKKILQLDQNYPLISLQCSDISNTYILYSVALQYPMKLVNLPARDSEPLQLHGFASHNDTIIAHSAQRQCISCMTTRHCSL